MDKDETINKLRQQIFDLDDVQQNQRLLDGWLMKVHAVLRRAYGADSDQAERLDKLKLTQRSARAFANGTDLSRPDPRHVERVERARELLEAFIWDIEQHGIPNESEAELASVPIALVLQICNRFHVVCRQLRKRRKGREPLEIADEYDVQYLLLALLKVHFDDIRAEEGTPSHAGSSSRIDFLLKSERIVIECKKTREGLTEAKLGEELIIDKERYRSHPDYGVLICLVYDPDGLITNPAFLERDLAEQRDDFSCLVVVAPK